MDARGLGAAGARADIYLLPRPHGRAALHERPRGPRHPADRPSAAQSDRPAVLTIEPMRPRHAGAVRGIARAAGGAHADWRHARHADAVRRAHPRDCRSLRCRVCAGEGGDQGGVGLRPPGRLAEGSAGAHAAHARRPRREHRVQDAFPRATTSRAACVTCACCSTATAATSPLARRGLQRGHPAGRGGGRHPATSPRPASTSPACSATGSGYLREGAGVLAGPSLSAVRPRSAGRGAAEPAEPAPHRPRAGDRRGAVLVRTAGARASPAALFLVACITDFLDGWLARRHGITGARPVPRSARRQAHRRRGADHAGRHPPEPRVPAWMAVVIVLRELAVTGLRGIAAQQRHRPRRRGARQVQDDLPDVRARGAAGALHLTRSPAPASSIDFHAAGMRFLWVALVLAVWSGVDYYVRVFRRLDLE